MSIEQQLSGALYQALARRQISNEGKHWIARAEEIVKGTGSQKAAADLIGVAPQTLRRWLKGTQVPGTPALAKLKAAGRRVRLSRSREANIRTARQVPTKRNKYGVQLYSDNRMKITGTFLVSSDERERTLDVGKHIPLDVMGTILDAWLAGDDTRAVAELQAAIREFYVADLEMLSISKIEFG